MGHDNLSFPELAVVNPVMAIGGHFTNMNYF